MATYPHSAVRVKVKKCELNIPPEWRKFSVDPQITSLEVLYSLLAKAFDIKSDFSIKYKAFDPAGNEIYLAVLSDWDLDAAFLRIHNLSIQTATEPCLMLQIDIKPFTEVKEWDADSAPALGTLVSNSVMAVSPGYAAVPTTGLRETIAPLQQSLGASQKYVQNMQTKLPGLIMNQMEKTFSIMQKAFNLTEETITSLPPRPPLSDAEFRLFLDALGQIKRTDELRKVIFFGGIEPSLRRVVWKHILNVYPSGMNGHQRMDYMRRKSEHYYRLREVWKTAVKQGCILGELSYVTSMVKKDVLRTDRLHPFYAGNDDNQNIASLFNILTTYALNHPSVSYCQGMSDIASPLLVTMNDEAQAYICFCAIMARVRGNFMLDGIAMTQKFAHLTEALSFYDPEFWEYLKSQQADDLLFCYRWLLLELKREFPFDDALRMLEVQWSSLKYETNVGKELNLYEKEFVPITESSAPTTSSSLSSSVGAPPISPSYLLSKSRENPYTKVCALRRQSSSASLSSLSSSVSAGGSVLNASKLDSTKRLNQSLDDNMPRHVARRQRHSSKAHQSLDESKMLMLMEGMENVKSDKDCESSKLESQEAEVGDPMVEEMDDEVFMNTSHSQECSPFNFHPTNPFKDDAQTIMPVAAEPSVGQVEAKSPSFAENEAEREPQIPKGIAKLQNKNILSNYNAVSNIIAKQLANASNMTESVKRVGSGGGGHFKDLKEKIAATSKKGMSFDDSQSSNEKSQQKLVKNFNEFLNFATINKNRIADKFSTNTVGIAPASNHVAYNKEKSSSPSPTHAYLHTTALAPATLTPHPLVQLTQSGFVSSLDESDSSSVPDTTWSNSTAATAIQQRNNYSSNSLQLDLNSLCSTATHTPDRTPTLERKCEIVGVRKSPSTHSPMKELHNDANLTPEDSQDQEYYPMTTAITRELRLEAENLDRQIFGDPSETASHSSCDIEYEKLGKDSLDMVADLKEDEIIACPDVSELVVRRRNRTTKARSSFEPLQRAHTFSMGDTGKPVPLVAAVDSNLNQEALKNAVNVVGSNPFIDEQVVIGGEDLISTGMASSNSLPEVIVPISTAELPDTSPVEVATNAVDEIAFVRTPQKVESANCATIPNSTSTPPMLPPPNEFGGGNPFLMFLCLTLLLQHRNTIMKSGMDYNEIAMHFDKMVRKHDVTRVLNQARRMYIDYLKVQNAYRQRLLAKEPDQVPNDINKNSNNAAVKQQLNAAQSYNGAATKS